MFLVLFVRSNSSSSCCLFRCSLCRRRLIFRSIRSYCWDDEYSFLRDEGAIVVVVLINKWMMRFTCEWSSFSRTSSFGWGCRESQNRFLNEDFRLQWRFAETWWWSQHSPSLRKRDKDQTKLDQTSISSFRTQFYKTYIGSYRWAWSAIQSGCGRFFQANKWVLWLL